MGGTKVALAHHKNDSVETMFMNLARGSGLKGLGGIAPVQGHFIRPLLCVERKEIEKYFSSDCVLPLNLIPLTNDLSANNILCLSLNEV